MPRALGGGSSRFSTAMASARAFHSVTLSAPAGADSVTEWNARAEAIAVEKRLLPPPNARGMAILHVAMFEAVNAIEGRYAPYRLKLVADRSTSKEAAAAAAASFEVLRSATSFSRYGA